MKKFSIIVAVIVVLSSLVFTISTFAANSHTQSASVAHVSLPAYTCKGAQPGNQLIDITEKVTHDADSGLAGNYWAFDTFTRTIQVWQIGSTGKFCGIMHYTGTFAAKAGQVSPGKSGLLNGHEVGTLDGIAQVLITAQLHIDDPAVWPLEGNVNHGNAVDYKCSIATDGSSKCLNAVDWTTKYFNTKLGFSLSEPLWYFTYSGHDDQNKESVGTWVNAAPKSTGDIFDKI